MGPPQKDCPSPKVTARVGPRRPQRRHRRHDAVPHEDWAVGVLEGQSMLRGGRSGPMQRARAVLNKLGTLEAEAVQLLRRLLDNHVEACSHLEQGADQARRRTVDRLQQGIPSLVQMRKDACTTHRSFKQAVDDCVARRQGQEAAKLVVRRKSGPGLAGVLRGWGPGALLALVEIQRLNQPPRGGAGRHLACVAGAEP